ncbi:MAG: AAA family ATPase [Patescibacteria group bacterium]|nr:AAA family ATPase [Patescibacteria group bacterium]
MTKLIIIRGPSAAGKSTVAKTLMSRTKRPTLLVDLDYYRFAFVNPPERDHNLEYELSGNDIITALELGFDVIFEGNFKAGENDPFLKKLFDAHKEENYLFYLDASLDETLKRHKTKTPYSPTIPILSEDRVRELYQFASPIGRENEIIIPEYSTLEQTVDKIMEVAGIKTQPPTNNGL